MADLERERVRRLALGELVDEGERVGELDEGGGVNGPQTIVALGGVGLVAANYWT